ncbi:hypothetical protein PIIN_00390 [Serendipita indica DSM 11827]|uniref:UDP-N-acetylglucosamine transferase subunit ALG14 n=1 Tax=Serendipita indica (strain DSM 11827) TaxID=1109443 RepID=G4T601_SERID|nr:hypothetical protein PIIN_00390 [Serendipita indica DSM 11827]
MTTALVYSALVFALFVLRAIYVIIFPPRKRFSSGQTCRLAIFLGSGGHTSEMLQMLQGLNFERYEPRLYLVSQGDILSAEKAAEFESKSSFPPAFTIVTIPRARKVLQPLWTTPWTTLISLVSCLQEVSFGLVVRGKPFADLLLLNGPGTCVPLFIAVFINRFLGLPSPRVVYVESFTRVKKLSLSAHLLRPFVDCFVVQWPGLHRGGRRDRYSDWLI